MHIRSLAGRIFRSFLAGATYLLGLTRATRWSCGIAETIAPVSEVALRGGHALKLHCPNTATLWRARSFHTKEPETLQWIEGFRAGESLLDVGANVGLYTLYAALRGHPVLAIEPEAENLALLNRNIFLNKLQHRARALGIGLDRHSGQVVLKRSGLSAGAALHTVIADNQQRQPDDALQQGLIILSLDELFAKFTSFFPSHIKIDVDGTEDRIIEGGSQTLKDARLQSVLIELNEDLPADRGIVSTLQQCGFRLAQRSHARMFDSGPYSMIYNYVFTRR